MAREAYIEAALPMASLAAVFNGLRGRNLTRKSNRLGIDAAEHGEQRLGKA